MKTRLLVALYLSGLAALLLARFGLAAQDPGSMASRVQRPASCANGEVLTYNSTSQQYECQPAGGGGGVPAGAILLIVSGSCPSGYVEETAFNGRLPLGTLAANSDIGTTGGSDNITPAGTVSQPTFTGNALAGHTHDYSTVIAHTHTQTVNTGSTGSQLGYGIDTSTTGSQNTGLSTASTGSATGATTSVSAGTPAGTVSQPTFTGTQFDNRSAFVRVIFCRKT